MAKSATSLRALTFVLVAVMINAIGFGIIIPVLPDLVREIIGTELSESDLGLYMAGMTFVFAIMQFIFMPIIGALSDAYGRRPVMLLSLLGLAVDYFILALAPTIFVVFLGRAIAGAFGATFSTANAYMADVSPPEKRAQNFALVGAAFGVGFMLGPVLGGILADPTDLLGKYANTRLPFIVAGIISLLNVILGFFVLPETLAREKRRPFSWRRANPLGALKSLRNISNARGLIFVLFLLAAAHTVYPTTYTISMNNKLNWTSGDVAWSLGAFGVSSFLVQALIIRWVIPRTGLFWAGVIGMLSTIIAYIGMGLATVWWVVYAMGPFAALAGFYNPALNNMMSSRVSETEQGELQGAIGAAQGLALIAGPLIMGPTYKIFTNESNSLDYPGAPFIAAFVMSVLALIIFFKVTTKEDRTRILPTSE